MQPINIDDAAGKLGDLVHQAQCGEQILLSIRDLPVAALVPFVSGASGSSRQPGALRGKVTLHADFDAPLPGAFLAAFRGE